MNSTTAKASLTYDGGEKTKRPPFVVDKPGENNHVTQAARPLSRAFLVGVNDKI